jgi:hypothetical protein
VAAVFVALILDPPAFQLVAAPPPAPPPPPIAAPAPPPEEPRWLTLAVAALYDDARTGGGAVLSGDAVGAEVQAAAGRRALGLVAAAGALTPTETTIGAVSVRQQRFPCSLAMLVRRPLAGRLELRGAGGVSLTPVRLRGPALATSMPATRLDAGARLAVEMWLFTRGGRVAPFVSLAAEYYPRAYAISVSPLGSVGSTAPVQIGLAVGIALEARRP